MCALVEFHEEEFSASGTVLCDSVGISIRKNWKPKARGKEIMIHAFENREIVIWKCLYEKRDGVNEAWPLSLGEKSYRSSSDDRGYSQAFLKTRSLRSNFLCLDIYHNF